MKHFLLILLLIPIIGFSQQKLKPVIEKQAIAKELAPEWESYVKACFADSSLQVFWVYTGKEKPEIKMDSTVIKGKKVRVITILPTQQMQWVKQPPTWTGFEEYLKAKK